MDLQRDTDYIDLPVAIRGKVRNVYDLGDSLLMVVTDRISAFDVVFDRLIPDKGKVLNSISAFWFDYTRDVVPNHVISTNPAEYPMGLDRYADRLAGRSMLVKKMQMYPAECIVRGYLEGSALKEYRMHGTVCGVRMPEGLRQADPLPEPMFTPSTKAAEGHDINITYEELEEIIGADEASQLRDRAVALYRTAAAYARERGLLLADTKFEFGMVDGELTVGDELFTPDSSRFWALDEYEPGRQQRSFDKQYLREWLESTGWDKAPPAPELPEEIVERTAQKYREAYRLLTGKDLA